MIYENKLLLKNKSTYKLTLSTFKYGINTETDENSLPYKYAKVTYNYIFKRGALQTGIGFDELYLPETTDENPEMRKMFVEGTFTQLNKLWLFPFYNTTYNVRDNMLVLSHDNKVKFANIISIDPGFFNIDITNQLAFTSEPNAVYYNINGNDVMLITSATDGMYVFHPTSIATLDSNAPKIISICRHYERVFAIEEGKRNKLLFSANLDPTNWTGENEAGYIEIIDDRGCLEKVVSFNDYVYIFKQYGISRLSAYGDQTEFNLSSVFVTSGKIYGNSVCVCGDRIMFLSRDGIYSFNGYSATKLSLNIESLFAENNDNCCCAYHNGKYYLGCRLKYDDGEVIGCEGYTGGYVNNSLIELDLKTGDISLTRGVDLKSLCSIEYETVNKLAVLFNNEHKKKLGEMNHSGKVFGTALKKVWASSYSNLGFPDKIKKIEKVTLLTKEDCVVKIKTDVEEKSFEVKGKDVTSVFYPNLKGEMFQFKIETIGSLADISAPEITFGISRWQFPQRKPRRQLKTKTFKILIT